MLRQVPSVVYVMYVFTPSLTPSLTFDLSYFVCHEEGRMVSLLVSPLSSRFSPHDILPIHRLLLPLPLSLSLSLSLCCCVLAAPLLLLVLVLVQLGSWKSLPNNISKYFLALTVVPHLERPKQASWLSILAWRAPLGSVLVGRHVEPDRGDERADEAVRGPPGGP